MESMRLPDYVVPNVSDVHFYKLNISQPHVRYNLKYELAFYEDGSVLDNKRKLMLSRIPKKNGKYRYYITKREETVSPYDCGRGNLLTDVEYTSQYVGNDLQFALMLLFSNKYDKYDDM